jgi:hypothetical protein
VSWDHGTHHDVDGVHLVLLELGVLHLGLRGGLVEHALVAVDDELLHLQASRTKGQSAARPPPHQGAVSSQASTAPRGSQQPGLHRTKGQSAAWPPPHQGAVSSQASTAPRGSQQPGPHSVPVRASRADSAGARPQGRQQRAWVRYRWPTSLCAPAGRPQRDLVSTAAVSHDWPAAQPLRQPAGCHHALHMQAQGHGSECMGTLRSVQEAKQAAAQQGRPTSSCRGREGTVLSTQDASSSK